MIWEIVGFVAGAVVSCGFIPQIMKGYKTKKLDDLSYFMIAFLATGMFLWLLYGIHINSLPVIIANTVGVSCNVILILMKKNYSKRV